MWNNKTKIKSTCFELVLVGHLKPTADILRLLKNLSESIQLVKFCDFSPLEYNIRHYLSGASASNSKSSTIANFTQNR